MSKFIKAVKNGAVNFVRDEEGAQIVEYALIIAVVSIVLIVAMQALTGVSFTTWVGRVSTCLTGGICV